LKSNQIKIAITLTAILLIAFIGYKTLLKPTVDTTQEPVYNGSLWRGMIPVEYLSYKAVEGIISYSKISTPRQQITATDSFGTIMVNSTTCILKTTDKKAIYYLVTGDDKPIVDNRYKEYLNYSTVYIYGNSFNYMSPDGSILKMIEPIEITAQPVTDLVDASEKIIKDVVGEDYFSDYFSSPVLWKDDWEKSRMYTVEYVYECEDQRDQSIRTVSLTFDSDRKLVDQVGVPDSGSLQPFKVSQSEAINIARDNGFPAEGEPHVNITMYTNPDEWESLSGNITLSYIDSELCAGVVELSHYLWVVDLVTPAHGSSPEVHVYAVIDVNSGEFYQLGEFRVVVIG
jgi:hypothetical protein